MEQGLIKKSHKRKRIDGSAICDREPKKRDIGLKRQNYDRFADSFTTSAQNGDHQ